MNIFTQEFVFPFVNVCVSEREREKEREYVCLYFP